jgi:hypothetical protein
MIDGVQAMNASSMLHRGVKKVTALTIGKVILCAAYRQPAGGTGFYQLLKITFIY